MMIENLNRRQILDAVEIALDWLRKEPGRDRPLPQRARVAGYVLEELCEKLRRELEGE